MFPQFSPNVFFPFQDPIQMPHYIIQLSCALSFLLAVTIIQIFLVFHDLNSFKDHGSGILKSFSVGTGLMFFSLLALGHVLGKGDQQVKCRCYPILSKIPTIGVNQHCLTLIPITRLRIVCDVRITFSFSSEDWSKYFPEVSNDVIIKAIRKLTRD